MMPWLSRLIDRVAIQGAAARMPDPDGRDPHLAEALQLIESAEFIPPKVEAAAVQFKDGNRICFATPRPGPFAENNMVHGRFYRCAQSWSQRPTVVLLHGWNDLLNHRFRFPTMAGQINGTGFNAATLEVPFHFQRRPRQLGAWSNFLCPDVLRTAEAIGQAVAEVRAFAEWLRQQGCPAVGLMGVSLGGLLTGLTIANDNRFACGALLVPVARLDRLLQEAAFCAGIRRALKGQPIASDKLNLTHLRPAIPREDILLIEATHDLFVPPATTEELWRCWDEPEIWRLPYGHISVLRAPDLNGRIIRWMTPRLLALASK
jgi:dienelactone hydrolase